MLVDWETPGVIRKSKRDRVLHTHTTVVEKGGKKEKERACVVAIT